MAKDKLKKVKKLKKDRTSPDRKKKKKKKSKTKEKDRDHDRSDTYVQPIQDVAELEMKAGVECKQTGDGDTINKTVPIKLGVNVASNNDATSGGWSWGAAFSAASKVQPNDADLDDNFLKAANSDIGGKTGVMDISQLANGHKMHKVLSNDATINVNDETESKLKRKRSESSIGSNDDDSALSKNSDDISLDGRMVPISTNDGNSVMSIVLVHKQSGKVYSSGERKRDGHRLIIGKLVKGNVELDPLAVGEMKQLEEGETLQDAAKAGPTFPYPTDPDDHCETPMQSYKDILPILNELNKRNGGGKHTVKIYDPYFCDGSVVKHLSSLGFNSVYNKKEDCYAVWKSNSEPQFDAFLTNPPYSDDHIEKLMRYVGGASFGGKPWLLLMPQWVHKKDYYVNATTKNRTKSCNPFYIVPKKRYVYLPPANFREKKESDVHKKSSPFVSMWYCWGGSEKKNEELMKAFQKSSLNGDCDVARSRSALRDLRRSGGKGSKNKKARTGK
eukprot:CAMPEP_0172322350 /NCGR_PEP_ID=MMETSP1058-20130122/45652_1 /TAXON_ID=83371 /ORGANISM="Detonula confervacea, Strain CCMP 353" /LENGTH=501 /DNA_ID=CAMNT_0013038073 /DNA_START=57 /DNA_END=1562 /DNA_ORIENTATION=-